MKTYMLGKSIMRLVDYNEPKTIKEAIIILDDYFELTLQKEKDYFNNSESWIVIYEYHHGLGQKIRNAWLWPKNENEYSDLARSFINLDIKHPDDMSSFLLKLFWYHKRFPDISIEEHQENLINEKIIKEIIE
jgi:hypothetical protein